MLHSKRFYQTIFFLDFIPYTPSYQFYLISRYFFDKFFVKYFLGGFFFPFYVA